MQQQTALAIDAYLLGAEVLLGNWGDALRERVTHLLQGERKEAPAPAQSEAPPPAIGAIESHRKPLSEAAALQKLLGTDYQLGEVIGAGAFGKVWLAYDAKLQDYVAIKSMRASSREREGLAKVLAFEHRGIIEILAFGKDADADLMWYEMALADDINGDDIIHNTYKPCTLANYFYHKSVHIHEYMHIAMLLCEAVAFLHQNRIVHRDLKPTNILRVHGKWKLADIGLLATFGSNTWVGTYPFAAPECPSQPTADIYSLGVMFKVMQEQITTPPAAERQLRELIAKATDPNPQHRFQTARQMLEALQRVAAAVPDLQA